MALNEMKLSNLGFLNVNRKLIDSRRYDSDLITKIGQVNIFENKASGFSTDSYLYKSGLSFPKDNLTISCACNFTTSETDQLLYLIQNTEDSSQFIELHFTNEQARLIINSVVVVQFSYLKLEDNTEIRTFVEITQETCKFTMYVHDLVFEKSANLEYPVDFSKLTEIYIGNEPNDSQDFWMGSVNLGTLNILQDNKLVYSPSANKPLVFSKVLISDGEFKLKDTTHPIANHIYEFKVSEITRSGGTVLLTSQIDDDSKLTIKEIGLYATTTEGEILFSSVSNLSINKGDGVPYDLVFTLNIYANFVNVVGFPDINSFVLKEPELCLFEDFRSIKDVVFYTFTNLERIIRMNAMDIGYNRSQVFYKFQKEITENEDCYFTIENFCKIAERLKRIVDITFDPAICTVHGNLMVPDNGITKNFSDTDYISGNVLFDNTKNWEVDFVFKSEEKETGTLLTLRGPSVIQPLIFQTRYDNSEDKMYLYAKLGKNNTTNEFVIDADLLELEIGIQYFIKFKYYHNANNDEDSYYQLFVSDDGDRYEEAFKKFSPRIILPVRGFSIGALSTYNSSTKSYTMSNPFKGTFYVNTFKIISNSEEWSPTLETVIQDAQLVQYYHIPDLSKSRYVLQDLCNPERYPITVLESEIITNDDIINFSDPLGFSICMNVDLKDNKSKMLLAKTNLSDKPYFLFAFLNKTIYFFLYTKSKFITLSKVVDDSELASYLSEPSLFTVVVTKNKMVLYRGVKELASFKGMFGTFRNYQYASLKNYIQADALKTICSTLVLDLPEEMTLDQYVEEVEGNTGRYIKDILAIQGSLSLEDIYYINTLMNS